MRVALGAGKCRVNPAQPFPGAAQPGPGGARTTKGLGEAAGSTDGAEGRGCWLQA